MSAFLKVTDKVSRFDRPLVTSLGVSTPSPLGLLDKFHPSSENLPMPDEQEQQALDGAVAEKTYADGLADGRLQALSEANSQKTELLELAQSISKTIQSLRRDIEASHERVLGQILQAVLPAFARNHQLGEIKAFITQISAPALRGRVTIFAPVNLHTKIAEIIQEISASAAPDVPHFKLDASNMTQGSRSDTHIRAKWEGGGGTIDIDGTVEQCLALLHSNSDNETNNKIGDKNGKA